MNKSIIKTISYGLILFLLVEVIIKIVSGTNCYLELDMHTSNNGVIQIFFDSGNSYSETESVVMATNVQEKYIFPLPKKNIQKIRIDPLNRDGSISITRLKIINKKGYVFEEIPLNKLRPIKDIEKFKIENNSANIQIVKDSVDPVLELDNFSFYNAIVNIKIEQFYNYLIRSAKDTLILGLAIFLLLKICIFSMKKFDIKYLYQDKPILIILLITFIFTALSCYPVIFYGKSFIHLANLALYDGPPYIPDFISSLPVENFRNSDII